MKTAALAVSLMFCAVVAVAKDVKVRVAWTRNYPDSSLGIIPDNLGNIAAVGSDTNSGFALLLDARGRNVARVLVPIPGVAGAAADSSGRIFITGNEFPSVTIHCAAFAPSLSDLLWVQTNNIGYLSPPPGLSATIGPLVSDEMGGVFVLGDWPDGLFMNHFNRERSEVKAIFVGLLTPYRTGGAIARAPNGDAFFIGNAVDFRDGWITVIKWNPVTLTYAVYGLNSPGVNGYSFATAAACDAEGNLIIVGRHIEFFDYPSRRGRCFTMKLDSNANLIWQAFYGPYDRGIYPPETTALAVALDASDNVVMTGTAGTVKYSSAGQVLWEVPETGGILRLDRFGNVLLTQQVGRTDGFYELEITKLNVNGTHRWQTTFYDGSSSDNRPAGLVLDDDGNVYFAATSGYRDSGYHSTIIKLVEHGQGNDK
jgi:hypothetical protein